MNLSETLWRTSDRLFAKAGLLCIQIKHPSDGFFAQMGSLVAILKTCEAQNLTPYIVLSSPHYTSAKHGGNFLSYFFDGPIYTQNQQQLIASLPIRRVTQFQQIPTWSRHAYPTLAESSAFFGRYYQPRSKIRADAENFWSATFGPEPTLGLHFRGTDKSSEATAVSMVDLVRAIDRILAELPQTKNLFIATDVAPVIEFLRKTYPSLKIGYRESEVRSIDGHPIHYSKTVDPYIKGHDAVLNCLLLSKCAVMLKTMSNLSGWAKVFNPQLKVYLLNRPAGMGIEWLGFPEKEMVESGWII